MKKWQSEDGNIKLVNGDCLEVIELMIEKGVKVDCIITDPPYKTISGGVSLKNGRVVSDGTNCSNKWLKKNENEIPATLKNGTQFKFNNIKFKDWIPKLFEVLNDGGHLYIMANDRNINEVINVAESSKFKLLNLLVWKKQNCTPNKYYMKNGEFIAFFRKGFAKSINNMGTKTIIEVNNIIGNKVHPSEKPIKLLDILIKNSTNENETVLDLFMGSGSTGVACKQSNRKFIGSEIDEKYFDIAVERIKGE